MLAIIGRWITQAISVTGYFGVFLLMAMESMLLPVPSELVMPFAGYLVSTGRFDFWLVAIISALGCVFGSLLSYAIGWYGATPFVKKHGKYILLEEKHLSFAEKYFQRKGNITIFICRFIPVVRHISSIPAGAGKMRLSSFVLYTFIGALIWNTILLYVGYALGKNWQVLSEYTTIIDGVVVIAIIVGVVYFWRHVKRTRLAA